MTRSFDSHISSANAANCNYDPLENELLFQASGRIPVYLAEPNEIASSKQQAAQAGADENLRPQ